MNAGILDTITQAFVSALLAGTSVLSSYSLGILAFVAIVFWCIHMAGVLLEHQNGMSAAFWVVLKIGTFYWISVNLARMALAAFHTFLQWGTAPAGGAFSAATFLSPSAMLDFGFRAARPVQELLQKHSGGMEVLWNFPTVVTYMLAFWLIILAFTLVAFHLVITIIEFHVAVFFGAIGIPWGALHHTAFLCEFAVSFLVGGLIRVMLTAAIMSIGIPLFETLRYTTTPGGDATLYSAIVFAVAAFLFSVLAWQVPARAAGVGARGMALALTGGAFFPQSAVGLVTQAASGAIRGTSRLLTASRS